MATLATAGNSVNGAMANAPGGIGGNGVDSANGTGSKNTNENGPIYVDTQHDDMIHDAQMDYYGTKLATSSSGKNDLYLRY